MCKEVDLLEQAYDKLPDIPHFSSLLKMCDGRLFSYETEDVGEFTSISLLDESRISIAKSKITKGTTVPIHRHANAYEILIIMEGAMVIDFLTHKTVLGQNDFVKIDREVPHAVTTLSDTIFIAITVPRDEGFPRR